MYIYRSIMILLFFLRNVCLADKKHFAKWIKTDFSEIYIFETLLGKGLDQCIVSCKAKEMCEYINFNVNADACFLIGNSSIPESLDKSHNDKIEKKKGYVLGKKKDWNLEKYKICTQCEAFGECKRDEESDEYTVCQKSGCRPPESKQFTVVHGNMFAIGKKIEYQCQDGYTDVYGDTGIVTCQDSGTWSLTNIKCVPGEAVTTCFGNNSCYLLDKRHRNWQDGKNFCESIGGHLADIKTELEYEFIKENIFSTVGKYNRERCCLSYFSSQSPRVSVSSWGKETYTWIGGNDEETEGIFIWTDGTRVDSGNSVWDNREPNGGRGENCLAYIPRAHKWHDAACSRMFTILCEF